MRWSCDPWVAFFCYKGGAEGQVRQWLVSRRNMLCFVGELAKGACTRYRTVRMNNTRGKEQTAAVIVLVLVQQYFMHTTYFRDNSRVSAEIIWRGGREEREGREERYGSGTLSDKCVVRFARR